MYPSQPIILVSIFLPQPKQTHSSSSIQTNETSSHSHITHLSLSLFLEPIFVSSFFIFFLLLFLYSPSVLALCNSPFQHLFPISLHKHYQSPNYICPHHRLISFPLYLPSPQIQLTTPKPTSYLSLRLISHISISPSSSLNLSSPFNLHQHVTTNQKEKDIFFNLTWAAISLLSCEEERKGEKPKK